MSVRIITTHCVITQKSAVLSALFPFLSQQYIINLLYYLGHHYKYYGGDINKFISYVWLIHLSKGVQSDSNSEYTQTYLSASLPFRSTQG